MSVVCDKAVVFPNTTVSSTNTTGGHEITEIFLKMTIRTYNPPSTSEVSTGDFLPPHPRPYHINRVLNQIGMNLTDLTLTNENNNMYALLCGGILVYLFNDFLLPYKQDKWVGHKLHNLILSSSGILHACWKKFMCLPFWSTWVHTRFLEGFVLFDL